MLTEGTAIAARAPAPAAEAEEILDATWAALGRLGPLLPDRLSARERERCGGLVGRAAPQRVRAVLRALRADAALFAGEPIEARALEGRQRRAAAYLHLCAILDELRRRARDGYLHEQAAAAEEAHRVRARLQHAAAAPEGSVAPALHRKALLLRDGCDARPVRRRRR